ncbi:MAG: hypothetical protein ACP5M4_07300, partial [Acidobacteriaceae bacterium]
MRSDPSPAGSCPACRARFRGVAACPRCGADLKALMLLSAHAYRLRQQARRALLRGECRTALACAAKAQQLQSTPEGSILQ